MSRRSAVVPLRSGALALFDPEVLAHRRSAPRAWVKDPAQLRREAAEGALLWVDVGGAPYVEVRIAEGGEGAGPARLRVQSGALFAGDAADLPSRAWGRRRWNLWDWLFAVFLASVVPVMWWLLGFDAKLLWLVAAVAAAFLLMLVPISYAVFRGGTGFARRTGVPPADHPEQLLDAPRGEWAVSVGRDGAAVEIRLSPVQRPAVR